MDFFEATLELTDEFPKEHLEFLNEFMNCLFFSLNFYSVNSKEEIAEILKHEKFLKHFLSMLTLTNSNETMESILKFFILSLKISSSLENFFISNLKLYNFSKKMMKDIDNQEMGNILKFKTKKSFFSFANS
jgi:hypothetical protein